MIINMFKDIKEDANTPTMNSKENRQWNEIRKSIQSLKTEFNKLINIVENKNQTEILELEESLSQIRTLYNASLIEQATGRIESQV